MVNVRGGLSVDEPSGERWELALELLGAGGEAIAIGNVVLLRPIGSPVATGQVEISIFTRWEPRALTHAASPPEVLEGLESVRFFADRDDRLQALFDRFGAVWDYRHDYGMGAVRLATVNDEAEPTWKPSSSRATRCRS